MLTSCLRLEGQWNGTFEVKKEPEDVPSTSADDSVHSYNCGDMYEFPLQLEGYRASGISVKEEPEDVPPASADERVHLYNCGDMSEFPLQLKGYRDSGIPVKEEKLWKQLTAELNAIGPATKSLARWRHYWTDKVSWATRKAVDFRQSSGGSVPGEAGVVLDVVGHDASNDCGSVKLPGRPEGSHDAAEEHLEDQRRLVDLAEAKAAASEQVPRSLLLLVAMLATALQRVVLVPGRPPTPPQLD
ncbi:hypothetical protein HPB47_026762 [Ixodes persulcatus]|uniref:Uncharacterized protein n=1 Tax=Ixodes persulcatus TaxID=34615 RepID=A0AC60Q064_IXOPE|nr:hypothetical protein HPB47_026762 [Ixodes persulcatus]